MAIKLKMTTDDFDSLEAESQVVLKKKPTRVITRTKGEDFEVAPRAQDARTYLLDELDDTDIIGMFCYGRRQFKAQACPCSVKELSSKWPQNRDFGVIQTFSPSNPPPKGYFLIRLPDNSFVAAKWWDGDYTAPLEPLHFWLNRPKTLVLKPRPVNTLSFLVRL